MWSQFQRLGLKAVFRPIKAPASSRMDWLMPQFRNWGSRSWYWSQRVMPHAHLCSAHTACVTRQCLHEMSAMKRNNDRLTFQIWIPWRYICEAMHKEFLEASSKAKTSVWVKVKLEDMEQFSTGSINKAVPSFRKKAQRVGVHEGWWRVEELRE